MSQEKISCVVVQWRQKNVQNSVLYVQRCCFAYQITFFFSFIFFSFFLFHVLESSLSGTLQNNEGDGNGNIKKIANTQTVGLLGNPVLDHTCRPSQQWRMKYLLHPFSSSPFGLQSTSPSQRQLRGIQRLPHENSSAEQLILSKNNKQKFDDLLNRHFSKQKIDKISQLENVLGEDRFLIIFLKTISVSKSNSATLVPITINIFSDSSRSEKNNYRKFHWHYLMIDHIFIMFL